MNNLSRQREALLTQAAELGRAIPHRSHCPRQPPVVGNIRCKCDVGDQMSDAFDQIFKIIVEMTTPS